MMSALFAMLTVSFTPHPLGTHSVALHQAATRRFSAIFLKNAADAAPDDEDRPPLINTGSIVSAAPEPRAASHSRPS